MEPTIGHDEFAFLIRRAGVTLPESKVVELYGAYAHIEAAVERVRRHGEAEPAHVFTPIEATAETGPAVTP
jgi:hypothetical protein